MVRSLITIANSNIKKSVMCIKKCMNLRAFNDFNECSDCQSNILM